MPSLESNQLVLTAADACDSKKAEDIRILALPQLNQHRGFIAPDPENVATCRHAH